MVHNFIKIVKNVSTLKSVWGEKMVHHIISTKTHEQKDIE